ncbi:hypothetical protein V8G54_000263 (mitochondrion) [Vigna mungo]|uniref:Uncharacterized protein n=1 Tax=Vigna mungo TaxID=3915 RepID=A0AAQ3PJ53_VIGMU
MRDFSWIRSFALTEAFGPSEKDFLSLRASKRERSKQSRSFARSKTGKQSCRISGSFPRPTKQKYNSQFAAFTRPEKGLYCSPLFDMFIKYQYKRKLHQSGKAPIEARSNL